MTKDRVRRSSRVQQWGRRAARLLAYGRGITARYAAAAITSGRVGFDEVRAASVRGRQRWFLA